MYEQHERKLFFFIVHHKSFPPGSRLSKKVFFTNKKIISEIIEIINSCNCIIGNESGPVCLGASLKKEVHSIYIPIHTTPESKIINSKTYYYNTEKENDETIVKKIIDKVIIKN